jgi:hypothetical protein
MRLRMAQQKRCTTATEHDHHERRENALVYDDMNAYVCTTCKHESSTFGANHMNTYISDTI